MDYPDHENKKNVIILRLLMIALVTVTVYAVMVLRQTGAIYDEISLRIVAEPSVVMVEDIGNTKIKVPTYDLFKKGHVWALVSKQHPLSSEPHYSLIDIPVAHGDAEKNMKVADTISSQLQQLVNAAEADGESLMVSSAYRSLNDQQETYDSFVEKNGKELASIYVLPVGASEHHTGLAVDLSSVSPECSVDSDSCSLSQSGAAWLAKNAYRYGFIQRYPEGEQEKTGVGFEPWHFRYIGKPLANAVTTSGLTYDEVVEKIAPGYATSR